MQDSLQHFSDDQLIVVCALNIDHFSFVLLLGSFTIKLKTVHSDDMLLPLYEAIASRAVFVIVSGSDGRTGGNAFGAS